MKKIIFILLFFISCNKEKNKKSFLINEFKNENDSSVNLLNERNNKYFLEFWEGMKSQDYYDVLKSLESKNIVSKGFYNLGHKELKIMPFYSFQDNIGFYGGYEKSTDLETDIINGINLLNVDEESYEIFKNKYKLPELISIKKTQYFLESNPHFTSSEFSEQEENYIEDINRVEIDYNYLQNFLKESARTDFSMLYIEGIHGEPYRKTIPHTIEIIKDNYVILFRDLYDLNSSYSGVRDPRKNYFYKRESKKSYEKRILSLNNYSNLIITYLPLRYYESIKEKDKLKIISDKHQEKSYKELKEKRTRDILDEI